MVLNVAIIGLPFHCAFHKQTNNIAGCVVSCRIIAFYGNIHSKLIVPFCELLRAITNSPVAIIYVDVKDGEEEAHEIDAAFAIRNKIPILAFCLTISPD